MSQHSLYSPSAAARQLACPGSIDLCLGQPDSTSEYAEEGTRAHEAAEHAVAGNEIALAEYPEEMIKHARDYEEFVYSIANKHDRTVDDPEIHTEVRIVSRFESNFGGTIDCLITSLGRIDVIDYKYGQGVPVEVISNPQLLDYLALATQDVVNRPETYVHIFQPRTRSDRPDHSWHVSDETLQDHVDARFLAIETHAAKLPGNDKLSAGDHCRFCRAKAICPELHRVAGELAQIEFDAVQPAASVNDLADSLGDSWPDRAAEILRQAPQIESLIKAVRARALADATNGVEIPGYKVTARRGNRRWTDPDNAIKLLAKRKNPETGRAIGVKGATTKTVISVAQAAKRYGKDAVADLYEKPDNGYKLVPVESAGEAITFDDPGAEFSDLGFLE